VASTRAARETASRNSPLRLEKLLAGIDLAQLMLIVVGRCQGVDGEKNASPGSLIIGCWRIWEVCDEST